MIVLDVESLRKQIEISGIKQKVVSEKAGISKAALCLILQGKRKCEAGEYASICAALGLPVNTFLIPEELKKGVKDRSEQEEKEKDCP